MPASSEIAVAVRLPEHVALHARPAGEFVREAAQAGADVRVEANGRIANAKSILEVLALGATGGTELVISASGSDAAEAIERLAELVSGLAVTTARSSTARADGATSASRASAAERSAERPRTIPRTRSMRAGATLSSSMPRPTKIATSSGTPAASPQTSTVIPMSCAAVTTAAMCVRTRGSAAVATEACGRSRSSSSVLETRSFVPIERKSASSAISLARRAASGVSIIAPSSNARSVPQASRRRRPHGADLLRRLHEWKENPQARARAGDDDRAELRRQGIRVRERERQTALRVSARKGGVLSAPKSKVRTVATRPRSRADQRLQHSAVLVLGRP